MVYFLSMLLRTLLYLEALQVGRPFHPPVCLSPRCHRNPKVPRTLQLWYANLSLRKVIFYLDQKWKIIFETGRLKYFLVQESSPSLYRSTQPLTHCEYESLTKEAKSVSESFAKGWNNWRGRGQSSHCTWHSPLFTKVRLFQLSPYHKFLAFPSLSLLSNSIKFTWKPTQSSSTSNTVSGNAAIQLDKGQSSPQSDGQGLQCKWRWKKIILYFSFKEEHLMTNLVPISVLHSLSQYSCSLFYKMLIHWVCELWRGSFRIIFSKR